MFVCLRSAVEGSESTHPHHSTLIPERVRRVKCTFEREPMCAVSSRCLTRPVLSFDPPLQRRIVTHAPILYRTSTVLLPILSFFHLVSLQSVLAQTDCRYIPTASFSFCFRTLFTTQYFEYFSRFPVFFLFFSLIGFLATKPNSL